VPTSPPPLRICNDSSFQVTAVKAGRNIPKVSNESMASLPVKDEGGSGALDAILGSPVKPELQNLDSLNPAGPVPTDIGLPHRRRPLPPEKSNVQSILRSQSQQQVTTLSPPAGQFLINTLLQATGIAAAVAFGVYAVKSVTVGNSANQYADQAVQQAVAANQFAILAVCLSNGNQVGHVQNPFRFREETH
jgi:hypothetical protein